MFDDKAYKTAWILAIDMLDEIATKKLPIKESLVAVLVATMQATYHIAPTEEMADELFLIARAEAEVNHHKQV